MVDSITVDEAPLSIGDQVAVFEFDDNTQTDKAVGSMVYTGQGGGSNTTTALSFDGSNNNYVFLPDDLLDGMGYMTIEFWIRSNGIYKSMNTVIHATHNGGNDFWIDFKQDRINIATQHGNLDGYVSHQIDQWYHVAMVREGSTLRIFEDGILLGENSIGSSPFNITGVLNWLLKLKNKANSHISFAARMLPGVPPGPFCNTVCGILVH